MMSPQFHKMSKPYYARDTRTVEELEMTANPTRAHVARFRWCGQWLGLLPLWLVTLKLWAWSDRYWHLEILVKYCTRLVFRYLGRLGQTSEHRDFKTLWTSAKVSKTLVTNVVKNGCWWKKMQACLFFNREPRIERPYSSTLLTSFPECCLWAIRTSS